MGEDIMNKNVPNDIINDNEKIVKWLKKKRKNFKEGNPNLIKRLQNKIDNLNKDNKDIKLDIRLDSVLNIHILHSLEFDEIFKDFENIIRQLKSKFKKENKGDR